MEPFLGFADRLRIKVLQRHSINPIISLGGTKKSFESVYTTSTVKPQLDAHLHLNSKSTSTKSNMQQAVVSDPTVALHSNQITSRDSDVTMTGMD